MKDQRIANEVSITDITAVEGKNGSPGECSQGFPWRKPPYLMVSPPLLLPAAVIGIILSLS